MEATTIPLRPKWPRGKYALHALWQWRTEKNFEQIPTVFDIKHYLQQIYREEWTSFISNQSCDNIQNLGSHLKNTFWCCLSTKEKYSSNCALAPISSHRKRGGGHMPIPVQADIFCDFYYHIKLDRPCNTFKYNRLCKCCTVIQLRTKNISFFTVKFMMLSEKKNHQGVGIVCVYIFYTI